MSHYRLFRRYDYDLSRISVASDRFFFNDRIVTVESRDNSKDIFATANTYAGGAGRSASETRLIFAQSTLVERHALTFSPCFSFFSFFFLKTKRTLQRSSRPFIDENFTATGGFPRERKALPPPRIGDFSARKNIAVYPISTAIENRATLVNSRLNLADFIPPRGGRRIYRGINIHGYLKNA